jgi:hypothetical protein
MADRAMHHGISGNLKHILVVVGISAAGESFAPYIITSQCSAATRGHLMQPYVRFGIDLIAGRELSLT